MALMVRNNRDIKGVTIGNTEFKISQFANDATCFLQDAQWASEVMKTLEIFKKFLALHINIEKSMALPVGKPQENPPSVGGLKTVRRTKILGIWFSKAGAFLPTNTKNQKYMQSVTEQDYIPQG